MKHQSYAKTTSTANFQGKTITITHLTPILSSEEREQHKREIEHQLYDVLVKDRSADHNVGNR